MATSGRTLIVVLEDSRARFLRREESGQFAEAAPDLSNGHDRNGDGASADRTQRRREFLQALMAALDDVCDRHQCERIIAVGPERMLSAFRKAASDKVRVRLWREAATELNGLNDGELEKRLAPHFL